MSLKIQYSPHAAQKPFHAERHQYKYRLLCGGTGSGKTLAGVVEDLYWCLNYPGIVGYVFEPSYPMVRRILLPTLQKLLGFPMESNPTVANYNRGDMKLTFKNGSTLWMGSLDDPERAEGPNIDFIHVDEARLIKKFETAWRVIQRRLRGSGDNHPVGAWVTTTPDAPGSPLFKFFEHPTDRDPQARVYRMRLDDNIHLKPDYVAAVKRAHTGGLYKRFVEGLFADVGAGSFDFDYMIHVQGFEKYYDPAAIRKFVYGVDFGWTNPSAVIAIGMDGDDRAFAIEEVYASQLSEDDLITECDLMKEKHGDGTFWCDSSEPRTITALRRAKLDAKPNKSKRDDGIREIGGRFKDAGDGRHRLYIAPTCVNLIEELQIYDAEKKEHDHATDGLRYGLMGAKDRPGRIEGATVYREREIVI